MCRLQHSALLQCRVPTNVWLVNLTGLNPVKSTATKINSSVVLGVCAVSTDARDASTVKGRQQQWVGHWQQCAQLVRRSARRASPAPSPRRIRHDTVIVKQVQQISHKIACIRLNKTENLQA